MAVVVTINVGTVEQLNGLAARMVRDAAAIVYTQARDNVDRDYPPASKPGESPRRRSGDGRRSIFIEDDNLDGRPVVRVGTSDDRLTSQGRDYNYMAHWERAGRPWLLPALVDSISRIEGVLASRYGSS